MKKWLTVYWCDFFVMMLIPFILIVAAKWRFYPILDRASDLAKVWVVAASVFILFAVYVGIKIRVKSAAGPSAGSLRSNFGEIVFVAMLALVGVVFSSAKEIIPSLYIWDILIVYWIVFTFSILKVMQKFINRCLKQTIFS